jgi:hypothetical protein
MKNVFSVKEYKKTGTPSGDWAEKVIGKTHEEFVALKCTGTAYRMSEFIPAILVIPEYFPILVNLIVECDYRNMSLYMIDIIKKHATYFQYEEACKLSKYDYQIEFLTGALSNIESKVIESQDTSYKLVLKVLGGGLCVGFFKNKVFRKIGSISSGGKCGFINNEAYIENYELWREKGLLVSKEECVWHEGTYQLQKREVRKNVLLKRIDVEVNQTIYDFDRCLAWVNCDDDNIWRFDHNHRPILF